MPAGNTLLLATVIKQSENQVSADMDGEVALMSIESGKYYCLNETGSRIWQLIEKPSRIADVCQTLRSEFDVDDDKCFAEVLSVLAALADEDLVEVVDAAAA